MAYTLKLDKPLLVNNKEITELQYDPMKITAAQFNEACARSSAINNARSLTFKTRQNDYGLHLYLGMMAVTAVMPEVDISDLERIEGYDVLELADIGMLFIFRRWGAASKKNNSEKPSDSTAGSSEQTSKTSEE